MSHTSFLGTVLLLSLMLNCAYASFGSITTSTVQGQTLTLENGLDTMLVHVRSDRVIEVEVRPGGQVHQESIMLDPMVAWPSVSAVLNDAADPIVLETSEMRVEIDRLSGAMKLFDGEGALVLTQSDYSASDLHFAHTPAIHYYGVQGGFHSWASDQLGKHHLNRTEFADMEDDNPWNVPIQQGNAGGPLAWSPAGFGVLVDINSYHFQPLNGAQNASHPNNNAFKFVRAGGESASNQQTWRWYGMVGSPRQVMESVNLITGKPQMYPKWAFGFSHSKWWNHFQNSGLGDQPQRQMREWIDGYRSRGIPLDNFALDFDWKDWGGDEFGWNASAFPKGATGELKQEMDALGIKLTGIVKARIHTDSANGVHAAANHYWTGFGQNTDYVSGRPARELDFSRAEVRNWFAQEQYAHAYDDGIISWWQDEGDERLRNTFSIYYAMSSYDWQRAHHSNRVHNLQRTFYLGAQRYGFGMWSGDIFAYANSNNNDWAPMARERMRMLASVNLGMPRWGMDAGSFAHTPSSEQYARWIQFAAFTPIMRSHASSWAGERYPWYFGSQAEAVSRDAIRFRYELLPYIYAYEHEYAQTGIGLVRPLFWEEPDNTALADYVDAWMFGDSLLVAPVVEQGQSSKSIYLPEGIWYDWHRGTSYTGGQTIFYSLNAATWEDIPLFVRAGGIVVTQPWMNYVGEVPVDELSIDIFPDIQGSDFTVYEDDGHSYGYESGAYFKQQISQQAILGGVRLDLEASSGNYATDLTDYLIRLHMSGLNHVSLNGNTLIEHADLTALTASGTAGWAADTGRFGDFIYIRVPAGPAATIVAQESTDLTVVTDSLPATRRGDTYVQTLQAINVSGAPLWSLTAGSLPVGLSLSQDGQITGTISASAQEVPHAFTVQVTDSIGSDSQTLSIVVEANSVPSIQTVGLDAAQAGLNYVFSLQASGGNGDLVWSLSAGALPGGVLLDPVLGQLYGQPLVAGTYDLTIRVSDADGDSDSVSFQMVVSEAPQTTLYAYEGFNGLGSGWDAWVHDDGGSYLGSDTGLLFGDLPVQGDTATTAYVQADRLLTQSIDFSGGEVWVAWLHRMNSASGSSVFELNRQLPGSPTCYVRLDTSGSQLNYSVNSDQVGTLAVGETTLFLLRLRDDNGTVRAACWSYGDGQFPKSLNEGERDTEMILPAGDFTLRNIGVAGWNNPSLQVDEIRVGDSYAAVLGVGGNPGMSYESWQAALLNESSGNQRGGDVDGDGLLNVLEYALGGDPLRSQAGEVLSVTREVSGQLALTFRYDRSKTDVSIEVQESSDLGGAWETIARSSNGSAFQPLGAAGAQHIEESVLSATQYTVTVKSIANTTQGSVFLRVRIP